MNNSAYVLQGESLSQSFVQGQVQTSLFSEVQLQLRAGECVAIIGASGAGKSTLLHILGGLAQPTAGRVLVDGRAIYTLSERQRCQLRNQQLGFVYQFHHLLPEFNAVENVCIPLLIGGMRTQQAMARARDILQRLGLAQRLSHSIGELSGGERQRVAIARAVVGRPRCVLADEPTGNLDEATALSVYELLLQINREYGTSFLLVTHDLTLARRMDRVLRLVGGTLLEESAPAESVG